jgi:hypothetical protein
MIDSVLDDVAPENLTVDELRGHLHVQHMLASDLSRKLIRMERSLKRYQTVFPAAPTPEQMGRLGEIQVCRFMFVFAGPDLRPQVMSDMVNRVDTGQYHGNYQYCMVHLLDSAVMQVNQLHVFVSTYNERVGADGRIALFSVTDLSGEPLRPMIPIYHPSDGKSTPVQHKCEFDRKLKHPALRVWTSQSPPSASRFRQMPLGRLLRTLGLSL